MHVYRPGRGRRMTVAAVAALVAWFAPNIRGQQPLMAGAARLLVQDISLPAIDRGLRDQDAPRAAREGLADVDFVDRSSAEGAYLRGSLIVKYKDEATRSQREPYSDFEIVQIPLDQDAEAAAAAYRRRSDVEYAQPRYRNYAMNKPNDPLFTNQWNFSALDMERAWDIQPGASSDIIVAVLDSGVAYRNATVRYNSRFAFRLTTNGPIYPALGIVDVPFAAAPELGTTGSTRFVSPRDFIWNDTSPLDLDSHGTHVTGTIGQVTNNGIGVAGMAYNVRIMPVKIIQSIWDEIFDSPADGTDDVVAQGIRYAADNGAKVINMSIGRTTGGAAPAVRSAMEYAIGKGAFIAVAAGNSKETGNLPNLIAIFAPQVDGLMTVGAVGRTMEAAFFSHTGTSLEITAPGGDQRQGGNTAGILQQTLDLDVLETYERPPAQFGPPRADSFAYYYYQGTSMATPHVSGFAALLMQQGITKPAAVEAAIKAFATDKGTPGRDDIYGYGIINPRATLRGLGLAK